MSANALIQTTGDMLSPRGPAAPFSFTAIRRLQPVETDDLGHAPSVRSGREADLSYP
jgi:hypothetical protein